MSKAKCLWGLLFLFLAGPSWALLQKPTKPPFDILHYKIDISLNDKDLTYQVVSQIRLRSLVSNLIEVTLHFKEGTKKIALPKPLAVNEETVLTVENKDKANERNQDGLFVVRPETNGTPQFFTQFETQGARQVFPCFDEPFEKATTEVLLTANEKYTLLSNGKKISEKKLENGLKQVHFKNDDPISTYHITLVAAELKPLNDTFKSKKGNVPLSIYTRPGHTQDVRYAMDILKKALKFYEDYFGISYPWDSYGIVALPGFQWGGMENKGLANLNEARLLWNETHPVYKKAQIAPLVAHELAHEWFGNMVTMYWWDDLWLNEAFATFMTSKFEEVFFGDDYEAIDNFRWLAGDYFPQDQGALSHPILPEKVDTIDELFDGITYTKGVQVVGMLEDFVGPDSFREGIRNYFEKHRLGNATTQEFLAAIEKVSNKNLAGFAKSWLHQKGFPILTLKGSWSPSEKQYKLQITQREPLFEFKLNIGNQTFHIRDKQHAFVLPMEKEGDGLPVNRGGRTLLRYEWQGGQKKSLDDADPFVRFETTYNVIQDQKITDELVQVLRKRLNDPQKSVALGVSWALIDNKLDPIFAQGIARKLSKEAKDLFSTLSKKDPIQTQLRQQLLTLLGQADLPELYSFLKAQVSSSLVDDQLGALAGLLRSNAEDRYTLFEETLQKHRDQHHAKLELLRTLALTPRKEVLAKINQYLSDPNLVSKDDSTIPIRVWRVVRESNKGVAYSKEGVQEIAHFVNQNLDRPSVAVQALRILEGANLAPQTVKKDIQTAMQSLLNGNPPDVVRSLSQKILAAAR